MRRHPFRSLMEELLTQPDVPPELDPQQAAIHELGELAHHDPTQFEQRVSELLRLKANAETACASAAETAEKLQQMIQELLTGHCQFCRLEALREGPEGKRAVVRSQGAIRELPIHPDCADQDLASLKPWEYVAVHKEVVVGSWRDDEQLVQAAQGDVVELRGYLDETQRLAHVADRGMERVVTIDSSLGDAVLSPGSKLVLQRDDPSRAIRVIPGEQTRSRFEVPIETLTTRLSDLAGLDDLACRILEDVLLRVCRPELRDQFHLEPLKGILLYSKPGMGKTALIRAIALWMHEHRDALGFDVQLHVVKPNETQSMWHGEDSRIVRELVWGPIRALQLQPRDRPLIILLVLDEIDSLGRRGSANDQAISAARTDALRSFLVEMDGLRSERSGDVPPVHVLCFGMTNVPHLVDPAIKRPGRFDLVLPMPDPDIDMAESVMAVYGRGEDLPWYLDGRVRTGVDATEVRARVLRPALARIYPAVVVNYKTDTQRSIAVTAGQLLANVHYRDAMTRAKKRAAARRLRGAGVPAVGFDDVVDCLLDTALDLARQMAEDPQMLIRQLDIKVPVASVEVVAKSRLDHHRFVVHSA